MYYAAQAAAPTRVPGAFLPFVFVSNACYGLVGIVMFGMSYVVVSDRDHYRMLKSIYISPAHFRAYFVGRGLARALEGLLGGGITLIAGVILFPGIRQALTHAQPLWLLAYLLVGGVMLWACGMMLAAAVLNMHRSGMFLAEGVAGVAYLLSGVIFPLSVLPTPLQYLGQILPTTYWLEGMRRGLTGPQNHPLLAEGPMAGWSNSELLGILTVTTFFAVLVADLFYRYSVRRAWRNGKIEETSGV
jgi:ABC-2 type transport system permease protein